LKAKIARNEPHHAHHAKLFGVGGGVKQQAKDIIARLLNQ